jgi:hypothetical protein
VSLSPENFEGWNKARRQISHSPPLRRPQDTTPLSKTLVSGQKLFTVGPSGWLVVMLIIGALVILKDFRFRARFLNPVFTAILALLMSSIIFAVAVVWYALEFSPTLSD